MGAFRTIAILVGDVVDGIDDAIRAGVRVGALHDLSFSGSSRVLQKASLVCPNAVAGFVTIHVRAIRVGFVNLVQDHGPGFRATTEWDRSDRDRANLGGGGSDGSNEHDYL